MSLIEIHCTSNQRHFLAAILNDDSIDTVAFGGARGAAKPLCRVWLWCCAACAIRKRGVMIRRTQSAPACHEIKLANLPACRFGELAIYQGAL